jgi:hypothetical protein
MSRGASIALDFADDTYQFALHWKQIGELQEKCDAGPYVILQRLTTGSWRIEDVSNVIRLGLIGGGMEPIPALKLVRSYVEARPPMESLLYAQAILSAGLMGAPDEDDIKKNSSQASDSTISQTANFA